MEQNQKSELDSILCDVCRKLATHSTIDLMQYEVRGEEAVTLRPLPGSKRYGCDDHPTRSNIYYTQQPLAD